MANPSRTLYIGIPLPPPVPIATVYIGIPLPPPVPGPRPPPPKPPPSSFASFSKSEPQGSAQAPEVATVQPANQQGHPGAPHPLELLTFKQPAFPLQPPQPMTGPAPVTVAPLPPPPGLPGTTPKSRWAFKLPPPPPTGRFSVFARVPLAFPKRRPLPANQPPLPPPRLAPPPIKARPFPQGAQRAPTTTRSPRGTAGYTLEDDLNRRPRPDQIGVKKPKLS